MALFSYLVEWVWDGRIGHEYDEESLLTGAVSQLDIFSKYLNRASILHVKSPRLYSSTRKNCYAVFCGGWKNRTPDSAFGERCYTT